MPCRDHRKASAIAGAFFVVSKGGFAEHICTFVSIL